jgi:hypothetical protein
MDEIDRIWSCNGLKYGTYKIFDTFLLINIDGDQNVGQKMTPLKTRSFLSLVVNLKDFGPKCLCYNPHGRLFVGINSYI